MQAKVNIVYPIDGAHYPLESTTSPNKYALITASFSTTYADGQHGIEWGFDQEQVGSGLFYDQMSAQFVYQLQPGSHEFWVKGEHGYAVVKFDVL